MPIGPWGSARGDIGVTLQLILDVVYCIRTCLVALHGAEFLMGSSPQLTRGAWSREDKISISPDVNNGITAWTSTWYEGGPVLGTLPTSRRPHPILTQKVGYSRWTHRFTVHLPS